MKVNNTKQGSIVEYKSILEFYDYLCTTPFNDAFRWNSHSSVDGSESFTKTKSFEDAVNLMKNGWSEMANKLTNKLKVKENQSAMVHKRKTINSVAGFQPIVPLYLSGVPNNMVSQKMVPVKQKVIEITKSVDYNGGTSTNAIIDESVKALQLIKRFEAMGYRVILNIAIGSIAGNKKMFTKVRIKNADEKLNISKLAFPLVHPSMLRRLFFRWIEVYPEVTKSFVHGYGTPSTTEQMKDAFPNDIIIPSFIRVPIDRIKTKEDLENIY